MKKMEIYEANDGRRFDNEKDAIMHDYFLEFAEWYNKDEYKLGSYYDDEFMSVYSDEMWNWLLHNKKRILEMFEKISKV